jgi:signal transduction histidine kinase
MRDVGHVTSGSPPPDLLLELDQEYGRILAMLDASAALQRLIVHVPELTGVDTAFTGEVTGDGQMVLHLPVNLSNAVEGLAAPCQASLGGRVYSTGRPVWISDYRTADKITPRFRSAAENEGLLAVIGVPIIHDGKFLGVLYGGNREKTNFGDRTTSALEVVAARMATAHAVADRARHTAEVAVCEERRRLAAHLHDTVGAMLFTLRASIQRLGDDPQLDAAVRAHLCTLEQQAAEASAALRGSMRVLHAPPEQVALGVALREHCRAFADRTGIDARLITLTELPSLSPAGIRALAYTAQEALLNVEKHAQARSVVVAVMATRGGVAVTVTDDGIGLPADTVQPCGLGLASITERVTRLGGTVAIEPTEDENGVTVRAWVPA